MLTRIPVGRNPKGLVLSRDGTRLFVANRLDDSISVIDTTNDVVVSTIGLGGRPDMTSLRRGERLFYSARFAFQGQFSCANCHIDSTFDGLQWDLEPDGFGVDIVDNRSIEDLGGTEPFKWNGGNPNMATECGPRTEKFFYRSQSYNSAELADLVTYVMALPYRPNRFRLPGGELTAAQERGKTIFGRTQTKRGEPIPEANQCGYCHSGPKYTNTKARRCRQRQAHGPLTAGGRASASECGVFGALPARRIGKVDGRDLDGVQSARHARRHQRFTEG